MSYTYQCLTVQMLLCYSCFLQAPEIIDNEKYTFSPDYFSLGCLIYDTKQVIVRLPCFLSLKGSTKVIKHFKIVVQRIKQLKKDSFAFVRDIAQVNRLIM